MFHFTSIGWSAMYSTICRSRAGLVALVFYIIISLVSAVPIPIYGLSSTLPSQDLLFQRDTGRIAQIPLKLPISTTTGALAGNKTPVDVDNQLVRRGKALNNKIKAGFKKAGQAIKTGFQKAGKAIKTGFQKVGQAIKKGAAKVAKFTLKAYSTITQGLSKVAKFVPVIGKPLGKALKVASKVADVASDKIHANLGKKLDKGMKVLNIAGKVLKAIPGRRDLSGEEGFQTRDISDAY